MIPAIQVGHHHDGEVQMPTEKIIPALPTCERRAKPKPACRALITEHTWIPIL